MDGNRARTLVGVPAHATKDQISRAFRGAAFAAHPDQGGSAAGFRELLAARDLLLALAPTARPMSAPNPFAVTSPRRSEFDVVDVRRATPTGSSAPAGSSFDDVLADVLADAA